MMILYTLLREILKVRVLPKYYTNFKNVNCNLIILKNNEIIIFLLVFS